jgi:3-isopropylmalate/(R)-2-methylmalate dehydratase small subunit
MSALVRVTGPAAPMLQPDINTDTIAPMVLGAGGSYPSHVRTQQELAQRLFGNWRYLPDGAENPDFILNREPFRHAPILIAGRNFACGSSRETAATMLNAFGIRCVIAPSFGLIFHDNCFRNHMLPLVLDERTVLHLGEQAASGKDFGLDLESCTLTAPSGEVVAFTLPEFRREMLLKGADELEVTLGREAEISAYQAAAREQRPWEWKMDPGSSPG